MGAKFIRESARRRTAPTYFALSVLLLPSCGLTAEGISPADAGSTDVTSSVADTGMPRDAKSSHDATTSHDAPVQDSRAVDGATGHDAREAGSDSDAQDSGPPCTSSCPNGDTCSDAGECASHHCKSGSCAACTGASQCPTLVCTDGGCAQCTPHCVAGAVCGSDTDCLSGYCNGGVCVDTTSCAALLAANSSAKDGPYVIEPAGATAAFPVYCDMTDHGGGWTLVLKMGSTASPGTFDYSAPIWTNPTLLRPDSTDMSQTEAKFQSYLSVPFENILAMMTTISGTPPAPNMLTIPLAGTKSLADLITTSAPNAVTVPTTTLSPMDWVGLTNPGAVIQPNCNMGGINVQPAGVGACVGASVRIGLIANDQADCCSPNSYVGFGGIVQGDPGCSPVAYSAGSMEGVACTGGTANIADFGYIFVR